MNDIGGGKAEEEVRGRGIAGVRGHDGDDGVAEGVGLRSDEHRAVGVVARDDDVRVGDPIGVGGGAGDCPGGRIAGQVDDGEIIAGMFPSACGLRPNAGNGRSSDDGETEAGFSNFAPTVSDAHGNDSAANLAGGRRDGEGAVIIAATETEAAD